MQTRWRQTRLTRARDEYSAALSRPTGLMSSRPTLLQRFCLSRARRVDKIVERKKKTYIERERESERGRGWREFCVFGDSQADPAKSAILHIFMYELSPIRGTDPLILITDFLESGESIFLSEECEVVVVLFRPI